MLDQLAGVISRHSGGRWAPTAVPRLSLITVDDLGESEDLRLPPMICFAAAGAHRTVAGDRSRLTAGGQMLLNPLEVPVTGVARTPYRAAVLHLDPAVLAGPLRGPGGTAAPGRTAAAGQMLAPIPPEVAAALTRWAGLLDHPAGIRRHAAEIEAEILGHLLTGAFGPTLRQFADADSGLSRLGDAAGGIHARFDQPLRIDAIAAAARMSVATLHRQFKAATGMSPIRFQKQLRLQEARRLLLAGAGNAACVAAAVGYSSAAQFNREYRRAYGLPPGQDVARVRQRLAFF